MSLIKLMPSDQRGIAHILILVILLAGLVGGLILIKNPAIFNPRAGGGVSGPAGSETSFTLNPRSSPYSAVSGPPFTVAESQWITVDILVRSDVETTNLFAAKLNFPADILELSSFQTNHQGAMPVSNWVEQVVDNQTGEASFIGGIPTPGYKTNTSDSSPVFVTLTFRGLKQGTADITFSSDSAIYSNSSNLDILTVTRPVTISVVSSSASPTPTPTSTSTPTATPIPAPSATPVPGAGNGDGNNDGKVNLIDLSILLSDFNKSSGFRSGIDLNGDNKINTFDFSLMKNLLIQNKVIRG